MNAGTAAPLGRALGSARRLRALPRPRACAGRECQRPTGPERLVQPLEFKRQNRQTAFREEIHRHVQESPDRARLRDRRPVRLGRASRLQPEVREERPAHRRKSPMSPATSSSSAPPAASRSTATRTSQAIPQSLSQFKDKLVIVDVWGSWSATCQRSAPLMAEFQAKYNKPESRIRFVSISLDKEPEARDEVREEDETPPRPSPPGMIPTSSFPRRFPPTCCPASSSSTATATSWRLRARLR